MSALANFKLDNDEEAIEDQEEEELDRIFGRCYDDLIEACKEGKVSDDDAIIGAVLSLMERIFPKLFAAYKNNPETYETRCLGCATALRVTISQFMDFDKFIEIVNRPEMREITKVVGEIAEKGRTDEQVDKLAGIFKNMKTVKDNVKDIYG